MITLEQIAGATKPILVLDYDGTLAPFVIERNRAFPYPGVVEKLNLILSETDTRVIVMTGRSVADFLPLLQLQQSVEVFGCHGTERLGTDGVLKQVALAQKDCEALEKAQNLCKDVLLKDQYEVKPSSIAVHYRGVEETEPFKVLHTAFEEVATTYSMEVHQFDGGFELRFKGVNKGTAINEVIKEYPDRPIAYLGDDNTDEDAFLAIGERGLKVLVHNKPRKTAADMRISPPEELLEFLDHWICYGRNSDC